MEGTLAGYKNNVGIEFPQIGSGTTYYVIINILYTIIILCRIKHYYENTGGYQKKEEMKNPLRRTTNVSQYRPEPKIRLYRGEFSVFMRRLLVGQFGVSRTCGM